MHAGHKLQRFARGLAPKQLREAYKVGSSSIMQLNSQDTRSMTDTGNEMHVL